MGSCCATVKPITTGSQNFLNPEKAVSECKLPDETELIPENRVIIRGNISSEKEKPGQEKKIFVKGLPEINTISSYGLSFSCKKGLKANANNQDDFSIIFENDTLLLSVFDGHGVYGHDVSHYLHVILPNMILSHPNFPKDIDLILSESFYKCNTLLHQYCEARHISSEFSGSTCTLAIIRDNNLIVSNIGDSRGIYETSAGEVLQVTIDHKPNKTAENQRISQSGGEVRLAANENCPRIFAKNQQLPGISISRAFGDSLAQSIGVIVEPDIFKRKIELDDKYLIIGSDGVWEFMSDKQVLAVVQDLKDPAKKLAELSWNKWIETEIDAVDDITAIVLNLQEFNKYLESIKD